MDWRCKAARAASSSRTARGTPLMVICTLMNALCHHRKCFESIGPFGSGSAAPDADDPVAVVRGSKPALFTGAVLARRVRA